MSPVAEAYARLSEAFPDLTVTELGTTEEAPRGQGWASAAGLSTFGPRQRWVGAVEALAEQGWPLIGSTRRWRHGEVTVRWSAVAPV